jgi:hypothetical protein
MNANSDTAFLAGEATRPTPSAWVKSPTGAQSVNGQCDTTRLHAAVRAPRPTSCTQGAGIGAASNQQPFARQGQPPRRPTLSSGARPELTSNPNLLRALRAAEMAVWDSIAPHTCAGTNPAVAASRPGYVKLDPRRALDTEALLWFALAGSALLGVLLGVYDISELLNGWSRFVQGIRNLIY